MNYRVAVLAGDGIGPEVMAQAVRVLELVASKNKIEIFTEHALIGGAAYDKYEKHFPEETLEICKKSEAILFGSVGGPIKDSKLPKWDKCETQSLLSLRKTFSFHANLRPVSLFADLSHISPLRKSIVENGVDILFVRELTGGIYFGEHQRFLREGKRVATDVCEYDEDTIREICLSAFEAARKRGHHVTSVDKANVLDTSRLWREVVEEVSKDYSDVTLEHMLVDNCAMQLIKNPSQFDVIVTSNMFGDILSDAAAVLPGSLGLMASASLNKEGFGMYEPSGGSAPDIAGKGIANPIAQILSVAMMFQYSFHMIEEANSIREAIDTVLKSGARTADIADDKQSSLSTEEMTDRIIEILKR